MDRKEMRQENKKDTSFPPEEIERDKISSAVLALGVGILFLFILFLVILFRADWERTNQEQTYSGNITVTGNFEDLMEPEEPRLSETQKKEEPETQAAAETQTDWQRDIFGSGTKQALMGEFRIAGLTASMRKAVNFKETDFLAGAAAFLSKHGLKSRSITIKQELDCSVDGIFCYLADLLEDEQKLILLMYPDYPGKYQFVLLDEEAVETLTEGVKKEQKPSETVNALSPETTAATEPFRQPQTEAPYDATRLSVTGLPETLDNYIANRYDLQYSLYNYLYYNGHRQVTSAAISDYSIDGDKRTATISFQLSDGGTVTGIYAKDNNSYSFY